MESAGSYKTLFTETRDMVFILDNNWIVKDINPAGAGILGAENPEELIGRAFIDLLYNPSDIDFFTEYMRRHSAIPDLEVALKKAKAPPLVGILSLISNGSTKSDQIQYFGILKEITNRVMEQCVLWRSNLELSKNNNSLKMSQATMVQQEKLASIGQLAAGLAHEIHNPLAFIKSNFASLKKYYAALSQFFSLYSNLKGASKQREKALREEYTKLDIPFILGDLDALFKESEDGIERIITILRHLKDFSHEGTIAGFAPYDLNRGVMSTLVVTKNEYKYTANVHTDLSSLPQIEGRGDELNQVLLNIVLNSIQAIKTQKRKDMGNVFLKTYKEEDFVYCEISDDGPGMSQSIQSRVFEPFFTTKEIGQGTGLGLSISYDIIVNRHQGFIKLNSKEGEGTTFLIGLPVVQAGETELVE